MFNTASLAEVAMTLKRRRAALYDNEKSSTASEADAPATKRPRINIESAAVQEQVVVTPDECGVDKIDVDTPASPTTTFNNIMNAYCQKYKSTEGNSPNVPSTSELALPNNTLRSIATHVSHLSQKPMPSPGLLQILQDQGLKSFDRRTVLQPTKDEHLQAKQAKKSGLLGLPDELTGMIASHLNPADLTCLAGASKKLFNTIDHQAVDIRNATAAAKRSETLSKHDTRFLLSQQQYEIKDRLLRDRMSKLKASEVDGKLACSACISLHPSCLFSNSQQQEEPDRRLCLAAQAKARVCNHMTADIADLRAEQRRSECDSSSKLYGHSNPMCSHTDHSDTVGQVHGARPGLDATLGFVSAHRKYHLHVLDQGDDDDEVSERPRAAVKQVLQTMGETGHICQHIKLDDERVMEAFRKENNLFHRNDWVMHHSEVCDAKWTFATSGHYPDIASYARRDRQLQLNVWEGFRRTKDAWSDAWLNHVEGGIELKKLRDGGSDDDQA